MNGFINAVNGYSLAAIQDLKTLADSIYIDENVGTDSLNFYTPSMIAEAKQLIADNNTQAITSRDTIYAASTLSYTWQSRNTGAVAYGDEFTYTDYYGSNPALTPEQEAIAEACFEDFTADVEVIFNNTLRYILDNTQTAYADKAIEGMLYYANNQTRAKGIRFDMMDTNPTTWQEDATWDTQGYYDQQDTELYMNNIGGNLVIAMDLLRDYMSGADLATMQSWATNTMKFYAGYGVCAWETGVDGEWQQPGNTGNTTVMGRILVDIFNRDLSNQTSNIDRINWLMDYAFKGSSDSNLTDLEANWTSPSSGNTSNNSSPIAGCQKVALNRGNTKEWVYSTRGATCFFTSLWPAYTLYGVNLFSRESIGGSTPMDMFDFQVDCMDGTTTFPMSDTSSVTLGEKDYLPIKAMKYIKGNDTQWDTLLGSGDHSFNFMEWMPVNYPALFRHRIA